MRFLASRLGALAQLKTKKQRSQKCEAQIQPQNGH
jgi:hypothetical protein